MLTAPMLDPTGPLVVEVREDSDVAALVGRRVRVFEPAGATGTYAGDALGPGSYKAFIVLVVLSMAPHPSVPATFCDYLAKCYGTDAQNATAVWGALVKAVHKVGARLKDNGLGIYISLVAGGGEQLRDPDTKQPYVEGTFRLIATAQEVDVGS